MKPKAYGLFLFVLLTGLLLTLRVTAVAPQPTFAPTTNHVPKPLLHISRSNSGVINTSNLALFGPNICSAFGDPFSPLTPNWAPPEESALYQGLYTYQFRIRIPAAYPHDKVRIELFDPDSINQPNNDGLNFTTPVTHTQVWVDSGRPAVETLSCRSNQSNACLIDTGEAAALGLPIDEVNLWWFARIDENRQPPCSSGNYDPAHNTQTIFELSYLAQTGDGVVVLQPLARYTGQTGDGIRDDGNHLTDMHWVSPGAPMIYDQPADVPTSGPNAHPQDYGSFELSLSQDLSDILVDPLSGDRYVNLEVTAVSGSSENGFMVWAGSPYFHNASNVNQRNLQLINNPYRDQSAGIEVLALGALPLNNIYTQVADMRLTDLAPEYAGQEIYVRLFDVDSGTTPPITFFFERLPETDWSMVFAASNDPTDDPDHDPANYPVDGRCRLGSCNNQWVRPAYKLTIPTYDADACAADPGNQYVCTPFYGGRLTARFAGGHYDTYVWQVAFVVIKPSQSYLPFVAGLTDTLTSPQPAVTP